MSRLGDHQIFTADGETPIITASSIEVLIGSDDSKNKGGGTVSIMYRQHNDAEWATVKEFNTADTIEDFKSNSDYTGQYQIILSGATSPDLQISWRM